MKLLSFTRLAYRAAVLVWLLVLAAGTARAQVAPPTWQWATSPGLGNYNGHATAVDAAGNVYMTGSFSGIATFGATTLTSAGGDDIFVAKLTSSGTYQWAVRAGGSDNEWGRGIAVDGSGNVVVTGSFMSPTIPFGTTTLTTFGRDDIFVAKLTPAGAWLWAVRAAGNSNESSRSIAVDGSGNVLVTGEFHSPTLTFGTITLANARANTPDAFVAKLSPAGVWLWATSVGGGASENGLGITVDASGNVLVTGFFMSPTITFGTTTLTNARANTADVFVARLTPAGVWQWAIRVGDAWGNDLGTGIAVDGSGNVLVTGGFTSQTITFGTTTLTNARVGANALDVFVAKLTPAGVWQWATSAGGNDEDIVGDLAVDGSGNVLVTGEFNSPTLTFGATTLTNVGGGGGGNDSDVFVAKLNPAGAWLWATRVGGTGSDASADLAVDGSGNVVVAGYFGSPTLTFGATTLTKANSPNSAIFFALLGQERSRLGGTVYLDANGNGTRNPGENLIEQPVVVEVQSGPFYVSTMAGVFTVPVGPGNYTLAIPNPPTYYTVRPATHSATFTANGQTDTTNHFGLQPTANIHDLRVTLTATSVFRPGRAVQYVLTCDNPGTTTQTGVTAAITLDSEITYQSSAPAATTVAGQTLTWNLGTLAPFQRRTLLVRGELPTTIQRGDSVTSVATITSAQTDVTPADNTAANTTRVVSSYDPNNKHVSTQRLTPAQVQAGTWLTYTIRFQNTGNDTAFTVLLRDTLSPRVQRGSLEVLAASHPLTWQLKDAGVADFRFPNILLPDSGRNEPASHGFVKYRVRVLPTLTLGDSVTNAADIYFDFNPPVRTNTTLTRVRLPLGTTAATPRLLASLYPNPAAAAARLTLETPTAGVLHIRVLNALGQVVWQEQTAVKGGQVTRTLPTGQWRAGIYHLHVRCGAQQTTQQLVVQP